MLELFHINKSMHNYIKQREGRESGDEARIGAGMI